MTIVGGRPLHSNRAGIFDAAGMVGGIGGSAPHGAHSTDHMFANKPDIGATANSGDTEHPSVKRNS